MGVPSQTHILQPQGKEQPMSLLDEAKKDEAKKDDAKQDEAKKDDTKPAEAKKDETKTEQVKTSPPVTGKTGTQAPAPAPSAGLDIPTPYIWGFVGVAFIFLIYYASTRGGKGK
jgi:hypothetical protein